MWKIHSLTLRFSKFLILCSIIVIACLKGVEFPAESAKAFSEEICFSILTLAAEGILVSHWQMNTLRCELKDYERECEWIVIVNNKENTGTVITIISLLELWQQLPLKKPTTSHQSAAEMWETVYLLVDGMTNDRKVTSYWREYQIYNVYFPLYYVNTPAYILLYDLNRTANNNLWLQFTKY